MQGDARSPDGSLAMAAPGGLPWGLLGGCAGAKIGKETQGAKGQRGKGAKVQKHPLDLRMFNTKGAGRGAGWAQLRA